VFASFSFGSILTNTLMATEPTIADGAILTGLGYTAAAVPAFLEGYTMRITSHQNSHRFGHLDTGYATWIDQFALINDYYKQPNYEIAAVEYTESTKAAFPIMELMSLEFGLGVNPVATNFTGPVLVVTGEDDLFACAGHCPPGYLEGNLGPFFSGSKNFEIAIHPVCGHSINFNKNATGAYGVITGFLEKNGL